MVAWQPGAPCGRKLHTIATDLYETRKIRALQRNASESRYSHDIAVRRECRFRGVQHARPEMRTHRVLLSLSSLLLPHHTRPRAFLPGGPFFGDRWL